MTIDSWSGAAGDGLWTTASNWTAGVPSVTSVVSITGNVAVTVPVGSDTIASLDLGSGATLDFSTAGTGAGTTYAVLDVEGTATLSGTVGLTLVSGYLPGPLDIYQPLVYAGESGTPAVNVPSGEADFLTPTSLYVVPAGSGSLTVTDSADSGSGSLRDTISAANASTNPVELVNFDLPASDAGYDLATGVWTIAPASALPAVTAHAIIDATTQPTYAGQPVIQLSGSSAGSVDGLDLTGGNSRVSGLAINGFANDAIQISTAGGDTVTANYLGIDTTGTHAAANGSNGVKVVGVAGNTIGGAGAAARNIISGNQNNGIELNSATGNTIEGNYIGTDVTGTAAIANGQYGITMAASSADTVSRNVISGNVSDGVNITGNGWPSGVVSYWSADGNANDSAGANNGAPVGGVTYTSGVSGAVGDEAFNFNGTDYVEVPNSASLQVANITMDGWIKPVFTGRPAVAYDADLVVHKGLPGYELGILMDPANFGEPMGTLSMTLVINGSITTYYGTGVVPNDGKYHFVAGTYDGSTMRLYIDGVSAGTFAIAGTMTPDTDDLYIGHTDNRPRNSQAAIDDVGIYNRALSASELQAIYVGQGASVGGVGATLAGNYIGTNATGTAALPNGGNGVTIVGSTNNTVGGTTAAERNIISGNAGNGIDIAGSGPTGVLVPAYFYPGTGGPGGVGDGWAAMTAAASQIAVTAIVNPDSGPLPGPADPNYVTALTNLEAAGGKVIAYIPTGYAQTPLATVEGEVNTYLSQYGSLIDGFFLDEMTNDNGASDLSYYHSLYTYLKGLNAAFEIIGNPGAPTQPGYLAPATQGADTLVTFENNDQLERYAASPPSPWVYASPANAFSNIVYNQATAAEMAADVYAAASHNAGSLYVTEQSLPNPYGQLPAYWSQEVAAIQSAAVSGATSNAVLGNFIGTDATGNGAVANGANGIRIDGASGNTVGGTSAAGANIISGNVADGVLLTGATASENVVEGNDIGTMPTGMSALANGQNGVTMSGASINTVTGNVIGGNAANGVSIDGDGSLSGTVSWWKGDGDANDSVQSNNGTLEDGATFGPGTSGQAFDLNGTSAYVNVPNAPGLNVTSSITLDAWINPTAALTTDTNNPQVIVSKYSFLSADMAYLLGVTSTNVIFALSQDGTSSTRTYLIVPVGNIPMNAWTDIVATWDGSSMAVYVNGVLEASGSFSGPIHVSSQPLEIGARQDAGHNGYFPGLIDEPAIYSRALSASEIQTIYALHGAAKGGATIQGNLIGVGTSGTTPLANGGNGVDVDSSSGATIGGSAVGASNIIAFNANDGVLVSTGTQNLISQNAIFSSGHLGIELANNGNASQAAPVLTSVSPAADSTTVAGSLTAAPNTAFTLEFFANTAGNPSGFGEGQTFLGAASVTTNASGVATFSVALPVTLPAGQQVVSATATDPSGDTSQFSNDNIGYATAVLGDNNPLDQVDLSAQDDGTVSFKVISGGAVINSGTIAAGTSVPLLNLGAGSTVTVNGTAGDDTFALSLGKLVINGVTLDASGVNANIASWQLNGLAGDDSFTVNGAVGAMSIDGGSGANAIQFASGSSLTGTIAGSGNTLDYSAYGAAVTVNLSTGAATATGGVSGITTVMLGDGASNVTGDGTTTLVGPHETNTWNLTSATGGTVVYVKNKVTTTITYAGIANLVGGAGNDTFQPAAGVLPAGSIDGGAGTNTLTFSKYASTMALSVDLHGTADTVTSAGSTRTFANIESIVGDASTGNTFTGPAAASTWTLTASGTDNVDGISFSKFPKLIGWSGGDTLIGPNLTNTWAITAPEAGSVAKTAFSGMANLIGGTGNDAFQLKAGGSVSGTIDGGTGAGLNTLDYTSYFATTSGTGVTVNVVHATADGIAGGFSDIQVFKGSKRSDTLTDSATMHTWTLTGSGAGNIDGVTTFSAFEHLTGSGGDTMAGANATATWVFSGKDAGSYNTKTLFVGMANIVGGTGADTFTFGNGATLAGSLDGGEGTNTINYAAYSTAVVVNLADGSATGVDGGADGMLKNIANATGGKGTNVLVGDSAANVLIGGKGRNVIIGGGGANTLTAGSGQDLLIAGTTSFDMSDADLALIAAEWFRTDRDFATRVADLSGVGTGGYTGPYLISDLSGTGTPTVFDNAATDTLNGNAGAAATDWFFAGVDDVIHNGLSRDETTMI